MLKIFRIIRRALRSTIPSTNPPLRRPIQPSPSGPRVLLPTQGLNPKSFQCPHGPTGKIGARLQLIQGHVFYGCLVRTGTDNFAGHHLLLHHSLHLTAMPGGPSSVVLGEFGADLILARAHFVRFYAEVHLVRVFVKDQVLF